MYKSLLRLQQRQCLTKLNSLVNVDHARHGPGKEGSLLTCTRHDECCLHGVNNPSKTAKSNSHIMLRILSVYRNTT